MPKVKLFVGVNLATDSTTSRLISNFRKRHDPKFHNNPDPHIALFAPFEIDIKSLDRLKEELADECDSFFRGGTDNFLSFEKLQTINSKKDHILCIKPIFEINLKYVADSLLEICKSYFKKDFLYKKNSYQLMPIGRFYDLDALEAGIQLFSQRFKLENKSKVESLVLYIKKNGHWVNVEPLFTFDSNDEFLQKKLSCV